MFFRWFIKVEELFRMRFITACLFAIVNLAVSSQHNDTLVINHSCDNPKKIQSLEGDMILGGLFPVHVMKKTADRRFFDLNYYALTWTEAMLYALDEINNNSSLLPKYILGFDIRDTCNEVNIALKVSLDFVLDTGKNASGTSRNQSCSCTRKVPHIGAVIGGAASPISTNVANVFGVKYIPQVSYSSTSILLSNKDIYPSFLRTIPSDTYQAKAIADMLAAFGWNYVSVIASDNAYGRAGMDALRMELKKRHICLAVDVIFHPDLYEQELRRIISSLKAKSRAMVIVLWCQRPNAIGLLQEATKHGLKQRTWIGTETWGDSYLLHNLSPEVIGGMIGVVPHLKKHHAFEAHLSSLDPGNSRRNPWLREFWSAEFGCRTLEDGNIADHLRELNDSTGSASANMLNYFIYKPNTGPDNVTIVCPRSAKGRPTTVGLPRNKYTNVMDAVYTVANSIDSILRCRDGGRKCPQIYPFINSKDLLRYIQNASFEGRSGSMISFDKNGDLMYGSYAIKSLQPDKDNYPKMKFIQIGSWEGINGKLELDNNVDFLWNGWNKQRPVSRCNDLCPPGKYAVNGSNSCCWTCVWCPMGYAKATRGQNLCTRCLEGFESNAQRTLCLKMTEDFLKWNSTQAISVIILSLLGATLTSLITGIFFKYKETAVVKASNRELSFVHLGCIFLVYTYPFLLIGKPTPVRCGLQPFYFAILFTLGTSIMLLKTDRLLRIFRARSRLTSQSHLLTNKMQILTASALTSLPVCIAIIWFIVRPPEVTITDFSENRRIISCSSSVYAVQVVILSYILVLALVCTYFAYKARTLPENFNEAKFIGFAMFSFCVFWLSFLPAFYDSVGGNRMFVLCLAILGSGYSVLGIMYFPKIRVIVFYPDQNRTDVFRINAMTMANTPRQSSCGTPPHLSPKHSPIESHRMGSTITVISPLSLSPDSNRRMSAFTLGKTIYTTA